MCDCRKGSDKDKNLFKRILERNTMEYVFTHHQKTICLDAPTAESQNLRRAVAFIGGLDVTDGR